MARWWLVAVAVAAVGCAGRGAGGSFAELPDGPPPALGQDAGAAPAGDAASEQPAMPVAPTPAPSVQVCPAPDQLPSDAEICFGSWCYESPWPALTGPHQVIGTSPRDVWLVTAEGVVHGDGVHWEGVPGLEHPGQVWPLAPADVWAHDGKTVRHWDGATWSDSYAAPGRGLAGIWAGSSSDVWAVGSAVPGLLAHFDGKTWSEPPIHRSSDGRVLSQAPQLFAVWGVRPGEVWAGGYGGWFVHCKDGTCTQLDTVGDVIIESIWGAAPDDVWAAGISALLHYDGTAWTRVELGDKAPIPTTVSGSGKDDVWMTSSCCATVYHWDGAALTRVDLPAALTRRNGLSGYSAVWAPAPGELWLGGYWSLLHGTGGCFAELERAPIPSFKTAWGSPDGVVWAADANKMIWRGIGGRWAQVTGVGPTVLDIWGSAADDVWAVGLAGTIFHGDGSTWTAVPSGTSEDLGSITGTGRADAWAVSRLGSVLHWDGSAWSVTGHPAVNVSSAWAMGPGDLWLMAGGTVMRGDGTRFDRLATFPFISTIWGTGPSDVFAVGGDGAGAHWDGATWSSLPGLGGSSANQLFAVKGDGGLAIAVGNLGTFAVFRGGLVAPPLSDSAPIMYDLAFTPTDVWAVGDATVRVRR